MITRRELAIILATLCMMSILFMTRPVSTQVITRPYDPWRDINGDGTVGPADLAALIASYGGTGDPTRNVNVTNWPNNLSGSEVVASNCLTAQIDVSGSTSGGLVLNSSETIVGELNLTILGGDVGGGATWYCYGSNIVQGTGDTQSQTSGFSEAVGRALFFDSNGNLLGEYTLPMTHTLRIFNVYRIRLELSAIVPGLPNFSYPNGDWSANCVVTATATLYWTQS